MAISRLSVYHELFHDVTATVMRFCEDFRVIKLTLSLNVLQAVPYKTHVPVCYDLHRCLSHPGARSSVKKVYLNHLSKASYHKPFTFLLPEGPLNKQ